MERRHKIALAAAGGVAALLILLWIGRAWLAAEVARQYFAGHGVTSRVEIGDLGLSGASGSFALGPADAPEVSARRIELHFDPLYWLPRVVEVRLVDPVIRARIDADGKVTLPSLQGWLDSLARQKGKSRWVSDDLAVALTGLTAELATPAGALKVTGDVKLVKNLPVIAHLSAAPGRFAWQGAQVTLQRAALDFDNGGRLRLALAGDVVHPSLQAHHLQLAANASGLRWFSDANALTVNLAALHVTASAADLSAGGQRLDTPKLDATLKNGQALLRGGDLSGKADLAGTVSAGLDAKLADSVRAYDPALARAAAQNLSRITLTFAAHAERHGGANTVTLAQPLLLTGAAGAKLTAANTGKDWHLTLAGNGLPAATLDLRNLDTAGGIAADASLSARFNYAMLRGAAIRAAGPVTWRDDRLSFAPTACLHASAAAFTTLAQKVSADLCPNGAAPMLTAGTDGWAFHARARNASAFLPLPNAALAQGAALLDFRQAGATRSGTVTVSNAVLTDRAPSARYHPLSGNGTVNLTGALWRGTIHVRDEKHVALGQAMFTHDMTAGSGTAHIDADKLVFAPDKLQPSDLSPLLVALKRAEGAARFTGDIGWSKAGFTSKGELSIQSLDFMTPLGKAHAVKSDIRFTSLLPPVTAPGQAIAIDRIDWTLPFSKLAVTFAVGNNALTVGSFDTDFAEGHATLNSGFTIRLDDPQHLSGTLLFANVSLQSLIAASNLAEKVKTVGTISGAIPFTVSPEGFRITDGHVAADKPGRLSLSRSLWAQGDAALTSNAVQDFAYQALENLAFSKMTADLKSIPGGRLQIVFHLVGQSDPPTRQEARVAVTDILNGTALYKQIPLPSGTPIDLTLDTSLNFDELLKSYAEAWSKSLSPDAGQGAGAKP